MANNKVFSGPQICVAGVNYSTTPIVIREKLGIPRDRMSDALACLGTHLPKGVILATCNRTEVYTLDNDLHFAENGIRAFLMDWANLSEEELSPHLYIYHNYRAMRRLSKITSGLYSMILGEHEILGQVRQALDDAEAARMINLPLNRLFQYAINIGRRVRDETAISRNAVSVSSVAVDLASKIVGDIKDRKAMLIGAGEAGQLVVKALAQRGVSQISVLNRSIQGAQQLASTLNAQAVDISQTASELASADIVITCTGSPHFVVNREVVENAINLRPDRSMVIVDIAVPRDVEPEVKGLSGVYLYDLDDLNQFLGSNLEERKQEVQKSLNIITSELENLLVWWQTLEVTPTIGALMQMAEGICQKQLSLTLKKLPQLSEEQENSLQAMTKSIVTKVLQSPVNCLKNNVHSSDDFVQIVRELFVLDKRGI